LSIKNRFVSIAPVIGFPNATRGRRYIIFRWIGWFLFFFFWALTLVGSAISSRQNRVRSAKGDLFIVNYGFIYKGHEDRANFEICFCKSWEIRKMG